MANICIVGGARVFLREEPLGQIKEVVGREAIEVLCAEVNKLRNLAAAAYIAAGEFELPERFLDALAAGASGEPFDTDRLLPVKKGE